MTAEPPVFVASDVGDLLSAVPTFFGFVPEESVIAVATHGRRARLGFRLRLDLPDPAHVDAAAEVIEQHIRRQRPDGVVLFVLSSDAATSTLMLDALLTRFTAIDIVACARADGERYWVPGSGAGVPYDSHLSHPAVVGAIAAGQEILPSRRELERRFLPVDDPAVEQAVEDQLHDMLEFLGRRPSSADVEKETLVRTTATLDRAAGADPLLPGEVATLALWSSTLIGCRLLATQIRGDNAAAMVPLWAEVARRAPAGMATSALGLAGFAAWSSGDGVQASIAAERAHEIDPDNPLGAVVLELLRHGVDPRDWNRAP